jgi:hypothetical protein
MNTLSASTQEESKSVRPSTIQSNTSSIVKL